MNSVAPASGSDSRALRASTTSGTGASPPRSTGWPPGPRGSSSFRRATVAGASSASSMPAAAAASAASTPAPPPLVSSARRSPVLPRKRASVSAAVKSWYRVSTRSMPARLMAASNTRSEPASARVCDSAARRPDSGPPRLHHDHRLVARRGPGGRHELARRLHRLHVEQDGAGARVAREVVEHVAEVDVGAAPERDHVREAHLPAPRPVEHGGDEAGRLRDEGHGAGVAPMWAALAFRPRCGVSRPMLSGPSRRSSDGPGGVERGSACAGCRGRGSAPRRPACRGRPAGRPPRARCGGGCRSGEVGRLRQLVDAVDDRVALEVVVLRVHREQPALEAAGPQVGPGDGAGAVGPGARPR